MCSIGSSAAGLPQGTELIEGPRVQRQVTSAALSHSGSVAWGYLHLHRDIPRLT